MTIERVTLGFAALVWIVALGTPPLLRITQPSLYVEVARAELPNPDAIAWTGAPDPWGTAWFFRSQASPPAGVVAPVCWSAGPNAENEWGQGDDVVLEPGSAPSLLARAIARLWPEGALLALALAWVVSLRRTLLAPRATSRGVELGRALLLSSLPAAAAVLVALELVAEPTVPDVPLPPANVVSGEVSIGVTVAALAVLASLAWRFTRATAEPPAEAPPLDGPSSDASVAPSSA
jgi:hypothetical protein